MKDYLQKLIPVNFTGKQNDLDFSKTYANSVSVIEAFDIASKKVLLINDWHTLSGIARTDFVLNDSEGNTCTRCAREGDYIQIDIPGPGPKSGNGYDWVKIEKVVIEPQIDNGRGIVGILVRACKNPFFTGEDTAHFFKNDATSSFIVQRKGNTVTASYHGRNEVLNTGSKRTKDNVRNAIVGAAAFAGGSEIQWNTLIKSFLK